MPTLTKESMTATVWEALGLQPNPEWDLLVSGQSAQDVIQFKASIIGNAMIAPDNRHMKITTITINGKWLQVSGIIYPDME